MQAPVQSVLSASSTNSTTNTETVVEPEIDLRYQLFDFDDD